MLTQKQLDFFHANGYLIMRGIFRGRELDLLQTAADRVIEEGIARIDEEDHRYMAGPHGEDVYWRSERMWERAPIFRAVTVNPDLLENTGQCIGQAFYPWNDSLVVKLPSAGAAVLWHQDPPYRNPDRAFTFAVPNFTTDIYLDHSGPDNGCVYAIPGHHLVGNLELNRYSEDGLFARAVPLEMEAGDALFHALSTPHGSRANVSPVQRRVFYVHFVTEEVYEDGYSSEDWAREKRGWSDARRELLVQMMQDRGGLELPPSENSANIVMEQNGFRFVGSPMTKPGYWATLLGDLPDEQISRMKALEE
jgi:phytanoyl-CoA hydroxylase